MPKKVHKVYKGILFDKDGTLIDTSNYFYQVITQSCNYLCEQFNLNQDVYDHLLEIAGINTKDKADLNVPTFDSFGLRNIYKNWFLSLMVSQKDANMALKDLSQIASKNLYLSNITNLKSYFEIFIRNNYIIGIATQDSLANTNRFVEDNKVSSQVSFVAGYDSGHGSKPGPGMFSAFCKHSKLDPSSVIMVGDSYTDMLMAEAGGAGMLIGIAKTSFQSRELMPPADFTVDNITLIPKKIGLS